MRKADKLFQLTNLLRAKQPITAEQIATELEVSVRTVYRYIDDLSVSGIPIYGTTGVGYQLHENFELPPLNLTEQELDALLLGVRMVSSWTGDELSNSANTLAKKIEAVLPNQLRDDYSDVVFAPDINHRKKDRKNWQALHQAIKNLKMVEIDYRALDGCYSSRLLYPLGLVYWGGKWTLAAWCTERRGYRNFRIDRILEMSISTQQFEPTKKINLQAYLNEVNKDESY